mmetsp:Transcript_31972/g.70008  ORF Transcript_31972/g.70008 Transcript_31972/m.70008 type:complete len:265 (-) Transcript_31972:191-985(-)
MKKRGDKSGGQEVGVRVGNEVPHLQHFLAVFSEELLVLLHPLLHVLLEPPPRGGHEVEHHSGVVAGHILPQLNQLVSGQPQLIHEELRDVVAPFPRRGVLGLVVHEPDLHFREASRDFRVPGVPVVGLDDGGALLLSEQFVCNDHWGRLLVFDHLARCHGHHVSLLCHYSRRQEGIPKLRKVGLGDVNLQVKGRCGVVLVGKLELVVRLPVCRDVGAILRHEELACKQLPGPDPVLEQLHWAPRFIHLGETRKQDSVEGVPHKN